MPEPEPTIATAGAQDRQRRAMPRGEVDPLALPSTLDHGITSRGDAIPAVIAREYTPRFRCLDGSIARLKPSLEAVRTASPSLSTGHPPGVGGTTACLA